MGVAGLIVMLYALGLFLRGRSALETNELKLCERTEDLPKIAILIPARDESAVIAGLLESIQRQTLEMSLEDVYVIVEDVADPSVAICRRYGSSVVVRKDLAGKQRKGYALDEAVKEILPKKHYDLYFVFDADNILSRNYLEKMLRSYYRGYQMATGYRCSKNANANVIAAVSSLTFSMINVVGNKSRIKNNANIIFSGTGMFVDGELVEKWQGWPFHSLTEDYEMSLYAVLHGIPTFYNEAAMFYDEQPTTYRQTVDQRVRWIKGYFSARKHYIPLMKKRLAKKEREAWSGNDGSIVRECIGVKPIIWLLVGVVFVALDAIIWALALGKGWMIGLAFCLVLGLIYIVLMVITLVLIRKEKLRLKRSIKFQATLYNPLYLVTYVPCALRALLKKNVVWKKIKHGEGK